MPTPPKDIPSLDHQGWIEHSRPLMMAPGRIVAGVKRGDEKLIKTANGRIIDAAVLRETHFECMACGGVWKDDGEFGKTRIGLDESSHYVPARKDALPFDVGFNISQWINRRLAWGPMMLEKLKTQQKADEFGNFLDLKKWWQKTAARTWDDSETRKNKNFGVSIGSYETDPLKLMPDFHSRNMAVDSQKKLDAGPNEDVVGSFWYVVHDFDKRGNCVQRARGFAKSWEELFTVQKFWKVANARVVIDFAKWPSQIKTVLAMNFEDSFLTNIKTGQKIPYRSCWHPLRGDKRAEFKINGRPSAVSPQQETEWFHVKRGGITYPVKIFYYLWSNLAFEMQLEALLNKAAGMPSFESLSRDSLRLPNGQPDLQTLEMEVDDLTYEKQISARYKTTVRGAQKFEEIKGRQAHYRDCLLMLLVRASLDGLLGHVQNPPEVVTETK
jgi:hypothetical protein